MYIKTSAEFKYILIGENYQQKGISLNIENILSHLWNVIMLINKSVWFDLIKSYSAFILANPTIPQSNFYSNIVKFLLRIENLRYIMQASVCGECPIIENR